ncbi:MAG: hypothetical protein IPM29_00415 [Planctomycetes bacterium]|nr:hypothetical protein [Planctomycetota bacterium]
MGGESGEPAARHHRECPALEAITRWLGIGIAWLDVPTPAQVIELQTIHTDFVEAAAEARWSDADSDLKALLPLEQRYVSSLGLDA